MEEQGYTAQRMKKESNSLCGSTFFWFISTVFLIATFNSSDSACAAGLSAISTPPRAVLDNESPIQRLRSLDMVEHAIMVLEDEEHMNAGWCQSVLHVVSLRKTTHRLWVEFDH